MAMSFLRLPGETGGAASASIGCAMFPTTPMPFTVIERAELACYPPAEPLASFPPTAPDMRLGN